MNQALSAAIAGTAMLLAAGDAAAQIDYYHDDNGYVPAFPGAHPIYPGPVIGVLPLGRALVPRIVQPEVWVAPARGIVLWEPYRPRTSTIARPGYYLDEGRYEMARPR